MGTHTSCKFSPRIFNFTHSVQLQSKKSLNLVIFMHKCWFILCETSLDFHVSAKKNTVVWRFQESSYLVTMYCMLSTSHSLTSIDQRKGHPHITSFTFTQNPKLWYSLVAKRWGSFGCPLKQCARVGHWLSHLSGQLCRGKPEINRYGKSYLCVQLWAWFRTKMKLAD